MSIRWWLLPILIIGLLLVLRSDLSPFVGSPATKVSDLPEVEVRALTERLGCAPTTDGFRAIEWQTGNSIEGYLNVYSCFAESDFRLTEDGVLVSAHDAVLSGNCGTVAARTLGQLRRCTLGGSGHIATLGEFLSLPLTEWYIDLKPSDSNDDGKILASVQVAVSEIQRLSREEGAILMIYNAPVAAVQLIQESGVRAALKWTPANGDSKELIRKMVVQASEIGLEAVSADIRLVDRETVVLARQLGVRAIVNDTKDRIRLWAILIDAGLSGLITTDTNLAETVAFDSN